MPAMNDFSREQISIALRLNGEHLRISDTSFYFDDGLDIEIGSGMLSIFRLKDFSGTTVGIDIQHEGEFDSADYVGDIVFDFAQLGLFDKTLADAVLAAIPDMDTYYSQLNNENEYGTIVIGNDLSVPFFRCSDGAAQVFSLMQNDNTIGVRILYGFSGQES